MDQAQQHHRREIRQEGVAQADPDQKRKAADQQQTAAVMIADVAGEGPGQHAGDGEDRRHQTHGHLSAAQALDIKGEGGDQQVGVEKDQQIGGADQDEVFGGEFFFH